MATAKKVELVVGIKTMESLEARCNEVLMSKSSWNIQFRELIKDALEFYFGPADRNVGVLNRLLELGNELNGLSGRKGMARLLLRDFGIPVSLSWEGQVPVLGKLIEGQTLPAADFIRSKIEGMDPSVAMQKALPKPAKKKDFDMKKEAASVVSYLKKKGSLLNDKGYSRLGEYLIREADIFQSRASEMPDEDLN